MNKQEPHPTQLTHSCNPTRVVHFVAMTCNSETGTQPHDGDRPAKHEAASAALFQELWKQGRLPCLPSLQLLMLVPRAVLPSNACIAESYHDISPDCPDGFIESKDTVLPT